MGDNTLRALTSDLAYLEAWGWQPPDNRCPGRRRNRCFWNSSPITSGTGNAARRLPIKACRLEPGEFSAHGLRSGYLAEAANRGIPLPEAMEQSRHRRCNKASSYYNGAMRRTGRAARML
uniref:Putative site-specific recombinase XerD n=1 Tax=Rhizobium rhizogenes TaxID=359 RepID=A0A7S4ZST1_RHIRH|nr:putative site-specific recombinase XerD [Rhizobium rhizogenes]